MIMFYNRIPLILNKNLQNSKLNKFICIKNKEKYAISNERFKLKQNNKIITRKFHTKFIPLQEFNNKFGGGGGGGGGNIIWLIIAGTFVYNYKNNHDVFKIN